MGDGSGVDRPQLHTTLNANDPLGYGDSLLRPQTTRARATEEWTWPILGFISETGDRRPTPECSAETIDGLASDQRGNAFTGMCGTVTDVEQCHSRVRGVADTFHSIATEMRKP